MYCIPLVCTKILIVVQTVVPTVRLQTKTRFFLSVSIDSECVPIIHSVIIIHTIHKRKRRRKDLLDSGGGGMGVFMERAEGALASLKTSEKCFKSRPDMKFLILVINKLRI